MKLFPKRAFISVSDKTGIVELASHLIKHDIEIISTGGTAQALKQAGIIITTVSEFTGSPEIMEGRVKSLHPKIHGAILGKRDTHQQEAIKHNILWIDLVICNLYPFAQTIKNQGSFAEAIENIDIGGPSMLRSAAKNMEWVAVIHDPKDYNTLTTYLKSGIPDNIRKKWAAATFAYTSAYDNLIQQYLTPAEDNNFPEHLNLTYQKQTTLRYGENPHQQAAVYINPTQHKPSLLTATQHQGKELSYNNINDGTAALECVSKFIEPTCVIVKHANPCGAASAATLNEAFTKAWQADSIAAFGGIIALNQPCTIEIAKFLTSVFVELVIAPSFTPESLQIFKDKPNCRILETALIKPSPSTMDYKFLPNGLLAQESNQDILSLEQLQVVTQTKPAQEIFSQLSFSWNILKYIKSNGIIITRDKTTLGIGAGQVSRIDAVKLALTKVKTNLTGAILASDAFFPFKDNIDLIAQTPIKTILQPGGSIQDKEVIKACDEHDIAMIFTGKRCFTH